MRSFGLNNKCCCWLQLGSRDHTCHSARASPQQQDCCGHGSWGMAASHFCLGRLPSQQQLGPPGRAFETPVCLQAQLKPLQSSGLCASRLTLLPASMLKACLLSFCRCHAHACLTSAFKLFNVESCLSRDCRVPIQCADCQPAWLCTC